MLRRDWSSDVCSSDLNNNNNNNNSRKNKDKRVNDKIIKKCVTVPLGIKGITTIISNKIIMRPATSVRDINGDCVTDNRYGEIPIIKKIPLPGVRK